MRKGGGGVVLLVFCWFVLSPCDVIDFYRPSIICKSVADMQWERKHCRFKRVVDSKYKS